MINYADIEGIYITESRFLNLQKLQENFYSEFKEILKTADENHKKYLKDLFDNIYSLRLKKILMHVIRAQIKDIGKPENILKEEEEIYYKILEIVKEKKEEILSSEIVKEKKEEEIYKKVKVRFLKECPAIVGIDLKKYGPFKKNEIALIIDTQAKIFIENKFAEILD